MKSDKFLENLLKENEEVLTYLEESRLLGHLPKEMLQKIVPLSELSQFKAGAKILEEGEINKKVYFLIRGEVTIRAGGEHIISLRRTGDIFGEMSIISNKPASASVIAETDAQLFSIYSRDIGEFSDLNPEELQNILYRIFAKVLTDKLSMTTDKAKHFEETNRRLEDTLKQLQDKVDEVDQTNQELKSTQGQLVQSAKLASLGEMATGIAHELNQPLANIRLRTEVLLENIEEQFDESPVPRLKEILKMLDRAAAITNHLRAFGRDSKVNRRDFSLNLIIDDAFLLVNEQLRLKNIKVTTQLSDNLPKFNCNRIQIEQALVNLILNARDAMKESEKKDLIVKSYLDGKRIYIEISDTGTGIPEDMIPNVFDPFFTTKDVGEGTGLGLSITHSIIREHKGQINIISEVDLGSTVTIHFPVSADDS